MKAFIYPLGKCHICFVDQHGTCVDINFDRDRIKVNEGSSLVGVSVSGDMIQKIVQLIYDNSWEVDHHINNDDIAPGAISLTTGEITTEDR